MSNLKEFLRSKLSEELINYIPSSFDIIGSRSGAVAIIEMPEELEKYKYLIADALLKINKHVKTVLRRLGPRSGIYRLYKYEVLIPGPTEVIHKEHGYLIKLDPTKVYFSPRDQTDRLEVAKMVRRGEFIIYMFAGVGPYAIAICKLNPEIKSIIAIEINSHAYEYMIMNIRLNKLKGKIMPILGNVEFVCPKYTSKADRVLMALPLGSREYLKLGIQCVKPNGGFVHFYDIGHKNNPFIEGEELISRVCNELGKSYELLNKVIIRDYAPNMYKIRIDFYVKNKSY